MFLNNFLKIFKYCPEQDQSEIAEYLIENNGDATAEDDMGITPLHNVASEGLIYQSNTEQCSILLNFMMNLF